mgnify:CR=1 FL=1
MVIKHSNRVWSVVQLNFKKLAFVPEIVLVTFFFFPFAIKHCLQQFYLLCLFFHHAKLWKLLKPPFCW